MQVSRDIEKNTTSNFLVKETRDESKKTTKVLDNPSDTG